MRAKRTLQFFFCILIVSLFVPIGYAADLTGAWKLVVNTEDGVREYEMALRQDGANVVAKLGEDEIKGTFENGALELAGEYYSTQEGYRAPLRLTGKLAGDELSGNIRWDTYDVTFRATRKQ
jgi:hypothetical protein